MHDPDTVAFEIKSPIKRKSKWFPQGYRNTLITIWHHDPETDHSDDSCGWFMRSRHGDKAMLAKIEKAFDFDWDRTFTSDGSGKLYFCGWFTPEGRPNMSLHAITINLFFIAAFNMMGREKANKYMQNNLFDILRFAENTVDSLNTSLTQKYGEEKRAERIHNMVTIIYPYILRSLRPWYKHPRWHRWHWRIRFNFLQKFNADIVGGASK